MELLAYTLGLAKRTIFDVAPIVGGLLGFQLVILRRPLPNARPILLGCLWVFLGLTLFLVGLNEALFPIGRTMAIQLTRLSAMEGGAASTAWSAYGWVCGFAATVGFATDC